MLLLRLCKETILQFPLILWFEPLMVGRAIYKIESRGILKILIFRLVTSELWKLKHPLKMVSLSGAKTNKHLKRLTGM